MASNKFKTIPIIKSEDYQLVYHSNQHGQVWLDANNRPIPLTQTLIGHINSTEPVLLWNSRVTKEGYHSVPPAISKGSAINSSAITLPFLHNKLQHIQPPPVLFKILSQSHKG